MYTLSFGLSYFIIPLVIDRAWKFFALMKKFFGEKCLLCKSRNIFKNTSHFEFAPRQLFLKFYFTFTLPNCDTKSFILISFIDLF